MEHQLKTNGSSIDLEKVVIKLGLIKSQQEEGSTGTLKKICPSKKCRKKYLRFG